MCFSLFTFYFSDKIQCIPLDAEAFYPQKGQIIEYIDNTQVTKTTSSKSNHCGINRKKVDPNPVDNPLSLLDACSKIYTTSSHYSSAILQCIEVASEDRLRLARILSRLCTILTLFSNSRLWHVDKKRELRIQILSDH